ncbi:hypothetical protein [Massilia sp. DWR3-1-1]|jgi:hypothetical protein|uniref:hypothetical protein n=1 Tax=Massilia sp. DWR3-1-1 TaxID=2804559 RepID=UPI003CF99173
MSNSNPTIVPVTVTITEQDGVFSANYDPTPAVLPGSGILEFTLDTPEWTFGAITFAPPFSDLVIISPIQFTIADAGGPRDSTNSFSVVIVQTAQHRGEPNQIDTDPEVLNGPHG